MAHARATRSELVRRGVNARRCRCVMFPRRVNHRSRVFASRSSPCCRSARCSCRRTWSPAAPRCCATWNVSSPNNPPLWLKTPHLIAEGRSRMSTRATMIDPERQMLGEVEMVGQDRWEEIHRRAGAGASIRAIARELDVDRKTVRRCLRQTAWKPYQRATRSETLLTAHAEYLRRARRMSTTRRRCCFRSCAVGSTQAATKR